MTLALIYAIREIPGKFHAFQVRRLREGLRGLERPQDAHDERAHQVEAVRLQVRLRRRLQRLQQQGPPREEEARRQLHASRRRHLRPCNSSSNTAAPPTTTIDFKYWVGDWDLDGVFFDA